ncbi:protein 4.1 isoform X2 [Latimeria chalumnae]|uniref:protein 4.1 isoform X2 n=1 Tax=Latimeria chalumnae TaxID=7897 RepID=UPI00313AD9C7
MQEAVMKSHIMMTEVSLASAESNTTPHPQQLETEDGNGTATLKSPSAKGPERAGEEDNLPTSPSASANGGTPSRSEKNQSKEQTAGGNKRLSSFFSSFLKRPKSQVSEEEEGKKAVDSESGQGEEEEIILKAPIADPEPELRAETDPTLDLHSLSSAETQPAQEDRKEDLDPDDDPETGEEGKNEEGEVKGGESAAVKGREESKSSESAPRRARRMHCKVSLLDETDYECDIEKNAKGQDLFKKVCEHLNLLEGDYFGLAIWDTPTTKTWLDPLKEIKKQVHGVPWNFTFNVKFYPPDPSQLSEDITRYYLCLQLRDDIVTGRLPCSFATLALLGSYTVHSELGEYDPDLHGPEYVSDFKLAHNQTKELEEKVAELHKTYRSLTPAQADTLFLENAKKLSMYGVDLHHAKDLEGVDILLGVCSSGLLVYKDKLRINRFPWPKVLKISYKRSSFFIKIRPGEQEQYESTIGFKLPNYKAAKKLWKVCVEHHTFFRLTSPEVTPKSRLLSLGSKFRYSGRTQAQTRQASALIDRPAPQFERTASKRASRSLDGATVEVTPVRSTRPTSAPSISEPQLPEPSRPAALVEARKQTVAVLLPKEQQKEDVKVRVEPKHEEKPAEKMEPEPVEVVKVKKAKVEVPVPVTNGEKPQKRSKRIEGENIYIRHSNLMLEDLDKTQEEIMRHHASISELKKNFMESVPEPRPSEWDKRLSTHSPFRTLNMNGQIPPGSEAGSLIDIAKPEVEEQTEWIPISPASEHEEVKQEVACNGSPWRQDSTPSSPPVVMTQTVTISNASNVVKSEIPTKEVPIVHTETKTITYEAVQGDSSSADTDPGILLTAQTITSETVSSTTTTQITKTVKGGISETRIEKRIVISGDADIDHDQALARAIQEAKEQHPDMSVTKVVVHQETEIADEE